MHREWTGLVNSPSILHAPAPHGCPLGASCNSLPDCTIKPRQLPEEPRWLLTMSVQCQVADILVRARRMSWGVKKTGREDVELKWMMACFKEYCFFDHKVPSLLEKGGGGWSERWRVMKLRRARLRSLRGFVLPRSSLGEREVRKFLLGHPDYFF